MNENTQTQILNKLEMVITVTQRNEKWLNEISVSVDELKADVHELKVKVEALDAKVEALDARVEALDTRVEALELRATSQESATSRIEARLDRIESDIAELKVGQEQITNELVGLSRGMDSLAGDYHRIKGRIGFLESQALSQS